MRAAAATAAALPGTCVGGLADVNSFGTAFGGSFLALSIYVVGKYTLALASKDAVGSTCALAGRRAPFVAHRKVLKGIHAILLSFGRVGDEFGYGYRVFATIPPEVVTAFSAHFLSTLCILLGMPYRRRQKRRN